MKLLNNLKFRTKLILIFFIPMLGLIMFSGSALIRNFNELREMNMLLSETEISIHIGNLIHQLQIERELSNGFIISKGQNFRTELQRQREVTDTCFRVIKETGIENSKNDEMRAVVGEMYNLSVKRDAVTALTITSGESLTFYSDIINKLISNISAISSETNNSSLVKALSAYTNFITSKENAGIERALLTGVLTNNTFKEDELIKYVNLIAAQQTYLNAFNGTSDYSISAHYTQKLLMAQSVFEEVEKIRSYVFSNYVSAGFEVWFKIVTEKIDAMAQIETLMGKEIMERSALLGDVASKNFWLNLVMVLISSSVVFLLVTVISSDITANWRGAKGGAAANSRECC